MLDKKILEKLDPIKQYVSNICWGFSKLLNAIVFGQGKPKKIVIRNDRNYYLPTIEEFEEAREHASKEMIDDGWTLDDYKSQTRDCDDFGIKMYPTMIDYITRTYPNKVSNKGVAIGFISYRRDSDKRLHVLVHAILSNNRDRYQEAFPEEKYKIEKILSKKEIASIDLDFM